MQVRTTGNPEAAIATVRSEVQRLEPNLAITFVQTIGQQIDDGLWAARMGAALLSLFGLLALILAATGVYGVLSYSVNEQAHEIGIRMALGAQGRGVLRRVVGQGLRLAGAGIGIGLPGVYELGISTATLLYGVEPIDGVTFVGLTAAAVVALVACWIPARRAMRVDPMVALRYE